MNNRLQTTLEKLERQINFVTKGEYTKELEEIFNMAREDNRVTVFTVKKDNEEIRRTNARLRTLLVDTCCIHFGVTRQQLFGKSRLRERVEARHVTIYLMRKYNLFASLKMIGKYFKRDHTTVIHAINNINSLLETDPAFKNMVLDIESIVFKEVLEEKWD